MVMMMSKTIEELEKELHNAKASLSYHKNKNRGRGKAKPKGESPRAKVNRLAANVVWNDKKKAMAHVVACLTANAADYKEAFNQAYVMPVVEVRDLVKRHEDEVEKQIKVLQETREARKKAKEPQQLSLALRQAGMFVEHQPKKVQPPPAPVKKTVPKTVLDLVTSTKPNYGDSEETSTAVPVKTTTLRLAKEVVSALTGFEGLSNEQVVGHILSRYLQYNKEKKL
jgi:hypothetical protein